MKMRAKPIKGTVPHVKHRAGVLPTKVERDKSKATARQAKHKFRED